MLLYVLGGVFGNTPDPEVYRGVGPMDYYVPAYVGLVIASNGVVGLPAHLAAYRERGVLRRFRASAVRMWAVYGAQVVVTVLVSVVASILMIAVAALGCEIRWPSSVPLLLAGFVLSALMFAAVGVSSGRSSGRRARPRGPGSCSGS